MNKLEAIKVYRTVMEALIGDDEPRGSEALLKDYPKLDLEGYNVVINARNGLRHELRERLDRLVEDVKKDIKNETASTDSIT